MRFASTVYFMRTGKIIGMSAYRIIMIKIVTTICSSFLNIFFPSVRGGDVMGVILSIHFSPRLMRQLLEVLSRLRSQCSIFKYFTATYCKWCRIKENSRTKIKKILPRLHHGARAQEVRHRRWIFSRFPIVIKKNNFPLDNRQRSSWFHVQNFGNMSRKLRSLEFSVDQ